MITSVQKNCRWRDYRCDCGKNPERGNVLYNSKITVVHGVGKKASTWLFEKKEVFSSASSWVFRVGP